MHFGVPQHRQRLIFVGIRADLGIAPSHPDTQTWLRPIRMALEAARQINIDGDAASLPTLDDRYGKLWSGSRSAATPPT
jgi:DNA (cytosine-5)-methyltransferase 1